MKKVLVAAGLLLVASTAQAAGAAEVLREFSKRMGSMKAFSLEYEYLSQSSIGFEERQSGSLTLAGAKYRIDMGNTLVVYDGAARYTYLRRENEVVIETPNPLRDGIFADPSAIFALNYKDFNVKQTADGGATISLELTPKQGGQAFERIALTIKKADYVPVKIMYYGTDGRMVSFAVSGFKANAAPDVSVLSFNIKDYPSAEVVDMR